MNNTRQIMLAWRMNADDNNDALAPNYYPYVTPFNVGLRSWVVGSMDVIPDATNISILINPQYSLLAAIMVAPVTLHLPMAIQKFTNGRMVALLLQ